MVTVVGLNGGAVHSFYSIVIDQGRQTLLECTQAQIKDSRGDLLKFNCGVIWTQSFDTWAVTYSQKKISKLKGQLETRSSPSTPPPPPPHGPLITTFMCHAFFYTLMYITSLSPRTTLLGHSCYDKPLPCIL